MRHQHLRGLAAAITGISALGVLGGALTAGTAAGAVASRPATRVTLGFPMTTATDSAGDVYVADPLSARVYKVAGGRISVVAGDGFGTPKPGPATSSPLDGPDGLAVDGAGNLYVADGKRVLKISPAGTLSVLTAALKEAAGLAVDAAGDVYVADAAKNVVDKITPAGAVSVVAGSGAEDAPVPGPATASPLDTPDGVALDSSGNLYIADSGNYEVEKVDSTGTLSIVAGKSNKPGTPVPGPATVTKLGDVAGIAADAAGDLYLSMSSDLDQTLDGGRPYGVVVKVDTAGTLSVVAGSLTVTSPPQVVFSGSATHYPIFAGAPSVDAAGNLYLPDIFDSVVEKVSGTRMTLFAGEPSVEWDARPKIKGIYQVGKRLTVGKGAWDPKGVKVAYQWYAGSTRIAHATKSSLKLTKALLHKRITVKLTGSKARYASATVTVKGKKVA